MRSADTHTHTHTQTNKHVEREKKRQLETEQLVSVQLAVSSLLRLRTVTSSRPRRPLTVTHSVNRLENETEYREEEDCSSDIHILSAVKLLSSMHDDPTLLGLYHIAEWNHCNIGKSIVIFWRTWTHVHVCYNMRSPVCLSSVCNLRAPYLLSRLKFSAMFLRRLVPWPSVDLWSRLLQ